MAATTTSTTGQAGPDRSGRSAEADATRAGGTRSTGGSSGRRRRASLVALEVGVGLLALAVFAFRAGTPSLWRDEAATLSAARRSVPQLLDLVRTEDLVHAVYYLLVHLALQVDDTITAARAVSVLAFAAAAALLVRLGRRLGSTPIGTLAALLLIATPIATRYAQNARSEGLVVLLALTATLLLLRALRTGSPRTRGRRSATLRAWAGYTLAVAALGVMNLIGLLLLLAHAVVVLALSASRRRDVLRWTAAVAAAGPVLVPFALASWAQRGQVSWITRPTASDLRSFFIHAGTTRVVLAGLLLIGAVVVLVALVPALRTLGVDRRGGLLPSDPSARAFLVGGAWGVLPPVVLWTVSQVHPLWDEHYVTYCLPGWLLAVAALPFLAARPLGVFLRPWAGGLVAALLVLVVAVAGLGDQRTFRDASTGHIEDLSGAARYVAANARPGDGVLFARKWLRTLVAAEPTLFEGLVDAALAQDPIASASLSGVEVSPDRLPAALAARPRVWLIVPDRLTEVDATATDLAKPAALQAAFRLTGSVQLYGVRVLRYERV